MHAIELCAYFVQRKLYMSDHEFSEKQIDQNFFSNFGNGTESKPFDWSKSAAITISLESIAFLKNSIEYSKE